MHFTIQVSNPAIRECSGEKRETLSSAILAVFPEATEDAIMLWNWVPVRVNYNCDLSVMMEDLLLMLNRLLQFDQGSHVTSFGASTFRAEWSLHWSVGTVAIDSAWESVAGSYEALLDSRRRLEVPREEFLSEWKPLLKKVIDAIDRSGITIEDAEQVATLRRIEAAIPRSGPMYESRTPD